MKIKLIAISIGSLLTSTAIFAAQIRDGGEQATAVSCRVLDGAMQEVKTEVKSEVNQGVFKIEGSGVGFTYTIRFADARAVMSLVNTNTGDKVTVQEGEFDLGEVVTATLETDEEPGKLITLECTAK